MIAKNRSFSMLAFARERVSATIQIINSYINGNGDSYVDGLGNVYVTGVSTGAGMAFKLVAKNKVFSFIGWKNG